MKYIEPASVGESLVSSYNIYLDTGITKTTETKDTAIVVTHINSNSEYYAVKMKNDVVSGASIDDIRYKWKQLIKRPVFKFFRWPVDIMVMNKDYYLVYDIIPTVQYKSLAELCFDRNFLGMENAHIRKIVKNYIEAFEKLAEKSYLFFGLDDDFIFIDPDDCSLLISMYSSVYLKRNSLVFYKMREYFSEVVDPYAYKNRQISDSDPGDDIYTYDSVSEHYAFASLLFRLLIGLYPFEGPSMSEYSNNQFSESNKEWIHHYLQNAVFIFDEQNTDNSITKYNRFKLSVSRWDLLTDELKTMFRNTFSESCVFRIGTVIDNTPLYSVSQWKSAVSEMFKKVYNEV